MLCLSSSISLYSQRNSSQFSLKTILFFFFIFLFLSISLCSKWKSNHRHSHKSPRNRRQLFEKKKKLITNQTVLPDQQNHLSTFLHCVLFELLCKIQESFKKGTKTLPIDCNDDIRASLLQTEQIYRLSFLIYKSTESLCFVFVSFFFIQFMQLVSWFM